MICPECRGTKSKVLETGKEGEVILRRRECKECCHRFNTCEAITHVRGSRTKKTEGQIKSMKVTASVAAVKQTPGGSHQLISQVEEKRRRAERTKRRRDAEDMTKYYSDEYVDTMVPDEEVQDLVDLFAEYD